MKPAPTATLVARLKREAKAAARDSSFTHAEALDAAARREGYAGWHELHQAHLKAKDAPAKDSPAKAGLPVDPKLRKDFDNTPNEDRSAKEIATWWDRPFVITMPDGSYDVRCLDGGAWDRSTWYGHAKTLEEAQALAERKLASWKAMREEPVVMFDDVDRILVVRMGQRPGDDVTELGVFDSTEEASKFRQALAGQKATSPPPQKK